MSNQYFLEFILSIKKIFIIGSLIAVIVIGIVIFSGGSQEQISGPSQSVNDQRFDKMPDLTFEDYNGNPVALADFAGQPLVVNAWATWCPFCVNELTDFVQVQEELAEQVVIIAIDRAEPRGIAKQFTDELGISDRLIFLLDKRDAFYGAIGGFSMPETIFADKDGNIRIHKRGPMKADEIRQKIQQIL